VPESRLDIIERPAEVVGFLFSRAAVYPCAHDFFPRSKLSGVALRVSS